MTLHDAHQQLLFQLYSIYDNNEAREIAGLVLEHVTGWKRIDRIQNKMLPLLPEQEDVLQQLTHQLLQYKPLQYVLNEAWFAGLKLYVDERVLIPRPETEELVDWVIKDIRSAQKASNCTILDIGTGSGCIALALKSQLPFSTIHACDSSEGALEVAKQNANSNHLSVEFHLLDILLETSYELLPIVDFIVSNPPYVPLGNKNSMHPNVLEYEPHIALFVADDDPLLFYKTIARLAKLKVNKEGAVYFEIHEELAIPVQEVLRQEGFSTIEIRKDMQGKDRMVKAAK